MLEGTPSRNQLLGVAALACAVRLFAACAIPFDRGPGDPNFAPDENGHLTVIRALAHGEVPVWPRSASSYSVFPPTQYAAQAGTFALGRALVAQPSIVWARLGSVLLGIAGSLLLARAGGRFLRDQRAGTLAGIAAALYPQYAFVTAYCNADAYTIFAGLLLVDALAAFAGAAAARRDRPRRRPGPSDCGPAPDLERRAHWRRRLRRPAIRPLHGGGVAAADALADPARRGEVRLPDLVLRHLSLREHELAVALAVARQHRRVDRLRRAGRRSDAAVVARSAVHRGSRTRGR